MCSFLACIWALSCSLATYSAVDYQGVPLDHKIIERMKQCKNGIFIEVGAFDGVIQSNTKLLEECYGWTGVLVEPSEGLREQLMHNRPHSTCYHCALGSFEEDNTYLYGDFDGRLMSSIGGERLHAPANYQVLVRSLQSILDEQNIQHVNFFSLDVEGYELNVIKGIDFNKTRFDYILIEIYSVHYEELVGYLKDRGYEMVENFSNYSSSTHPDWDGTHNDYLFQRLQY